MALRVRGWVVAVVAQAWMMGLGLTRSLVPAPGQVVPIDCLLKFRRV